jgi:hypothetical protein
MIEGRERNGEGERPLKELKANGSEGESKRS